MKRALLAATLAGAVVLAPQAWAGPATVVLKDDTGDTGINNTPTGDLGAPAGMDITKGTLQRKGGDLVFTVSMASMPARGSMPEAARLIWHFDVDKVAWRVTAKSVDVGKPDVVAGSGTERIGKVDQAGHFRLEQCGEDTALPITRINCKAIAYLKGAVDPAAKTISWSVPLATVKGKPGQKIKAGSGGAADTCPVCWVLHVAERSVTATMIVDSAAPDTWTIPKK